MSLVKLMGACQSHGAKNVADIRLIVESCLAKYRIPDESRI